MAHEEEQVNLHALIGPLVRRRMLVLCFGGICAVLALMALSFAPTQFKSTATLMLEVERPDQLINDEGAPERRFEKDRLKNEVSVLQSSDLAARVVDRLDLRNDTRFRNAEMGVHPIRLLLAATGSNSGISAPQKPDYVASLQKNLKIQPVDGSRVIQVTYLSEDRQLTAKIANGVAEQYIEDQLTAKLDARTVANDWLLERVADLRLRLEAAENQIAEERAKLSHSGGQGLHLTEQQISTLNEALARSRRDTLRLRGLYERLSRAVAEKTDLSEISEFRNSLVLRKLRFEEGKLLSKRAEAVQTREIALYDAQLGDVRAQMDLEAARIVAAVGVDLESAESQDRTLAQNLRELETLALGQSKATLKITQLEREADANRGLYESFLKRLQSMSKLDGLETPDARLVSRALVPAQPISRHVPVVAAAAGVAGLMLGTILALLLERMNPSFRGSRELEQATGLPVLATIPTLGPRMKRKDVVRSLKENPNSALAEAVRNLRTSVLLSNRGSKVVMLTSTAPAEGKSTTAMLLALTARNMGKSVIIVDCDLRRPTLATLIASPNQGPGLLSVLTGQVPIDAAVVEDIDTGLHALMMRPEDGRDDNNAADLLASPEFSKSVELLRSAYDLVILDTPPALAVTDARIVAGHADSVLYGVRWAETPRGAVEEGLKELQTVAAPIAGLVMTMVDEKMAARYAGENFGSYRGRYAGHYVSS